ncbi:MAG: redoxin domain-containing protein [Planctomycetaceae bacterium]
MLISLGALLPWLLLGATTWIGYQLRRQNGRILLRLESIEARLPARSGPARPPVQGLPVGSPAPEFELPDLEGRQHTLSEFLGREILLVFFNPGCGFCTKMAPDLADLRTDGSNGSALPIVITTGAADANRELVEQHGLKCLVLLQSEMEVAGKYRAHGTPMGYRVDSAGRIASELAIGGEPLLSLATANAAAPRPPAGLKRFANKSKQPDPSLARSRINRSGLKAGTLAPEFQLPRIDGGELALQDYRGRRVLLVFSDPECGPCDELAPHLQELHAGDTGLQVLMISREDADATRAKAAARPDVSGRHAETVGAVHEVRHVRDTDRLSARRAGESC